jgi:hypothetical protein
MRKRSQGLIINVSSWLVTKEIHTEGIAKA